MPSPSPRTGFYLLLTLLALLAAGKVILADTMDPDAFWHIRVGQEIARQTWPHPLVDDISFTSIRTPWTPYSWLAEVGMAKLWDSGGFGAAIAVQALMEAGFIFLLGLAAVELSRRLHGQPRYLASAVGAAFGGILSLAYLSFRPVTGTIVLLTLIAWLLLRDRRLDQRSKFVWLVPPITAIATNFHFFAFLSPFWIALLLLGDFMQNRRIALRPLALFFATLLASLCSPLLAGTVRSILDYRSNVLVRPGNTIAEFQPFYHGLMGNIALAFFIVTTLCARWRLARPPRIPMGEFLWLMAGTVLLFDMGRFAPCYAIIAVPVFAAGIPQLSDRILARPAVIAALATVLVVIAVPIARAFPGPAENVSAWLNRNGPDAPNYPCKAADFVAQNIPARSHHIFCDFTWGGFLDWRLAGQYQTLMDGRSQVYSSEFWTIAALAPPARRQQYLSTLSADAAIVRAGPNKLRTDLTALGWKTVFKDEFAEVWIPPQGKFEIRNSKFESISKSE